MNLVSCETEKNHIKKMLPLFSSTASGNTELFASNAEMQQNLEEGPCFSVLD